MKNHRLRIAGLFCGLLWLGGDLGVRAEFITPAPQIISRRGTDWSEAVTFEKFDPALGILNSVQFSIEGGADAQLQLRNTDNSPGTFTYNVNVTLTLRRPDNSSLIATSVLLSETQTLVADPGNEDPPITNTPSSFDVNVSGTAPPTSATAFSPSSDAALFTGPGTIVLPVSAVADASVEGPANRFNFNSTNAGAIARLVYDFTPVAIPEPSAMVLMALGGGWLLRRGRRRSSLGSA